MVEAISDLRSDTWGDVLGHVRTHHPAVSRRWFDQLEADSLDGGELVVRARNEAQLEYLVRHCVQPFVEAAQAATGHLVGVRFVGMNGEEPPLRDDGAPGCTEFSPLRLNGDYLFENFVVGPCNRLAHATCLGVGDSPGTVYNPLFIHGRVGLGKTHLLQAVCHRVLDQSPAARIIYLTCETFMNDYVDSLARGVVDEFRFRYRHADVLVIDDIQFLSNRDQIQEEFFHTFNTLYQLNKQIILSADGPPASIPSLEERLVSRFNWGMVSRIDPPCLETRMAILRRKMIMKGLTLPEDVVLFIAERVQANARELEGALNRIHAVAALEGQPVDMDLARQSLGEPERVAPREIRLQEIIGAVVDRFNVKVSDLTGRRRSRSIAFPRQVCMYLARQFTHHSLEEIGGFFGGRDHTTVIHANRLISQRREEDAGFRSRLEEIEGALRMA